MGAKMDSVIVACDSFKGSMSAAEVCSIIKKALCDRYGGLNVISVPVADGGEGTVDAYLAAIGGEKVFEQVRGPQGQPADAYWGRLPGGRAVIECAQASGLNVDKNINALTACSYGTGQLISAALDSGAEEIIIGLGGSAVTDGGAGLLTALGVRFSDINGDSIKAGGEGLCGLCRIDTSRLDKRLETVKITVLCDVTNPLFGESGAAYVYAPQKGASAREVELLDAGLRNLSAVCVRQGFGDFSLTPGAGAAGGMGFGLLSFTNATTVRGIDAILDITDFDEKSKSARAVITGEGKMDFQSLFGKAVSGVTSRSHAKRNIAVVGVLEADSESVRALGIDKVYQTNPDKLPFECILPTCREALYNTACGIEL